MVSSFSLGQETFAEIQFFTSYYFLQLEIVLLHFIYVLLHVINAHSSFILCSYLSDSVPSLTHLSRLAVRASVGSLALSKTSFVRQLPVPIVLQDYLQFTDVSPV